MSPRALSLALAAIAQLSVAPVLAQGETGSLLLELNALQASEAGCRVTFLATNTLGAGLDRAGFEVALFGEGGAIDRLVGLDFQALPEGKTKVLQFDLKGLDCDSVSRVLVNDVSACEGGGLAPGACIDRLETRSNTGTAFGV